MNQRARKFAGVWLLLALLIAYPVAATLLYTEWLGGLPVWAELVYFVVTGLGWALPAGLIIKWMAKPDSRGKNQQNAP